jgi:hypothetical protein
MTDASDRGPLTFRLWYPRWDTHDGHLRCRFQATTMGDTQIGEGSDASMTTFLADLGVPAAKAVSWTVTRYRTPSLSDFPDSSDWADRFAIAWDVTIQTDNDADPDDTGTHDAGPHPSHAMDETFADEDDDWDRSTERVIVLAGRPYGPPVDPAAWSDVDGVAGTDTEVFEGFIALDLGEIDLADNTDRVDAVLSHCVDLGLRKSWKD